MNHERAKVGRAPLTLNRELGAQKHAEWMASRRKMQHAGKWAENIAAGQSTPEQVVRAWMRSDGHRRNILSKYRRQIDVGKSGRYWCQRFR